MDAPIRRVGGADGLITDRLLWLLCDEVTYPGLVSEVMDRPSVARRFGIGVGGALVGLVLLLDLYLGLVLAWAWFSPWPPAWPGVLISLVAALVGPTAALLVWRSGRRGERPRAAVLRRTELLSGAVGVCSLVVLFGMIFMTAI